MFLLKIALSLLLVTHIHVTAYVKDSELFPFLESSGSTRYFYEDDGFVGVNLQQKFQFLNINYSNVYLSGNGYITFGEGLQSTGYICNKSHAFIPTAAVYMADSDNRQDRDHAKLLFRQDTRSSTLNKISKDVFHAFPALEGKVILNWMLIATWYNIPPYEGSASARKHLRNTFQAILTNDVTGKFSFFLTYYGKIMWPSGPETSARVGIFGGNTTDYFYLIPGSCTNSLLNIGNMSNFYQPGKFAFRVDSSVRLPSGPGPTCFNKDESPVKNVVFKPSVVSVMEKQLLLVQGLDICLGSTVSSVVCVFHDRGVSNKSQEVMGLERSYKVLCQSPDFYYSLGKLKVDVHLRFNDGRQILGSGYINVVKMEYSENVSLEAIYDDANGTPGIQLSTSWNPVTVLDRATDFANYLKNNSVVLPSASIYVNLTLMELADSTWKKVFSFDRTPNNGSWVHHITFHDAPTTLLSARVETPPSALTISTSFDLENGKKLKLTCATNIIHTTTILAKLKSDQNSSTSNIFDKKCKQWHDHEPQPPVDVFPCPPTLEQASNDWRFSLDISSEISVSSIMNSRNYTIYLQSVPSSSGAGSQCSYDEQGLLVIGYPYGSRMYKHSSNNWKHHWEYYWDDVMPYLHCCELSYMKNENCRKFYFSKRAPNFDYLPPVPFRASGATHIAGVDGKTYLLDQIGTFFLIKYENQLEMQVLTERYTNQNSTRYSSPVVITTVVIQLTTETSIQSKFQVSANIANGMLIWLDDNPLNFFYDNISQTNHEYYKENWKLYHNGVNVLIKGTSEAIFSFYDGLSVKFMITPGNQSINIIGSVSSSVKTKISGILSDLDGSPVLLERWRVPKNESLFRFPTGKAYENYINATIRPLRQQNRDAILNSISADIVTTCGNVEDCQIDYMLTNDAIFSKSSISAYEQYEVLLNASKISYDPVKCSEPVAIENGKLSGDDFKIGGRIEVLCNTGYYLNITNKQDEELLENHFACTPGTHVTTESNLTNEAAIWVSPLHFEPIANFMIKCMPINENHVKFGKRMEAIPHIITEMGMQSLVLTLPNEIDTINVFDIICSFTSTSIKPADLVETHCTFLSQSKQNLTAITCPTPILRALGKVNVKLVINYLSKPSILFETQVWFESPSDDSAKLNIQFYLGDDNVTFLWEPSIFTMSNNRTQSCNLKLVIIQPVSKFWETIGILDSEICNSGSYEVSVESVFTSIANISKYDIFFKPTVLALTVMPESHTFATSGLLSSVVMLHEVTMTASITSSTAQNTTELSSEEFNIPGMPDFDLLCSQWYQHEGDDLKNAKGSLACPRSAILAGIDWRFRESNQDSLSILSSNAAVLFVGSMPFRNSQDGVVVACAYNDDGELMVGSPTGSYVNRYHPNSWKNGWYNHYIYDTLPYLYCCKWSKNEDNCPTCFYEKRGIPFLGHYDSPKFAHVWGAGHFHTFDGLAYRFNGAGEFWMIKSEAQRKWNKISKFTCQVRLEPYTKVSEDQGIDSQQSKVSVITAVAMSEIVNDEKIVVEVFRNVSGDFYVLVNGDLVDSSDINSLYFENVNLLFNRTSSELLVVFEYGFSFKFTISGISEPGMNIIISSALDLSQKSVNGLLGNLDGESSNDLTSPSGNTLPANSSIESIHVWFGMQWIVQRNESLFSNGKSIGDFSTLDSQAISIALLPQHSTFPVAKIREICDQDSDCMFDALATGSEEFTVAGKLSRETFQEIVSVITAQSNVPAPECVYTEVEGLEGLQRFSLGSELQISCYVAGTTKNVTFTCKELENGLLEWASVDNPDLYLNTCLSVENSDESKPLPAVEEEETFATNQHQIFNNMPVVILSGTTLVLFIVVVALTLHVTVRRKYSALEATHGNPMANDLLELNEFN